MSGDEKSNSPQGGDVFPERPASVSSALEIEQGRCYIYYAFDLGISFDLKRCERMLRETRERTRFRHNQRAPKYFDFNPSPIRISQKGSSFDFPGMPFSTTDVVEITVFDFGSVSVLYSIDLRGPLAALIDLSEILYENEVLLADARTRVESLFKEIQEAIFKPELSDLYEHYLVFHVDRFVSHINPILLLNFHGQVLSQILRCERKDFAQDQVEDALSCVLSYSPDDSVVIDWNAAFMFGSDVDDVRAVLEFGNVELLELRYLDQELDEALERSYVALNRGYRPGSDLRRVAQLQVDAAMMFEGVNNALKLLGDQYLARVYSLVSRRFHLNDWDGSILRKLDTLDSIYGKLSDRAAHRRSTAMEVIVIVLIAVEVILSRF